MAREQPIVAIDFMGLGMIGDMKGNNKAEEWPYVADSDASTFMGPKDCDTPSKTCTGRPTTASMNNGTFSHIMAFAGKRPPVWSKAATFQHLLSPRSLHEEKLLEQSAENVPERSYSHGVLPMQTWWRGDSSIKHPAGVCDNHGSSTQILGSLRGTVPMNAFFMSNISVHADCSDAVQKRMPIPGATDNRESAPLTIFYGGSVNVFNDITAEQAQAIMFLACNGNVQSSCVDFLASASISNTNIVNLASKFQLDNQACCNVEAATTQAVPGSANMQLDFGNTSVLDPQSPDEPVVPSALPQARKASLARFLEKRRERVIAKAPYRLKQVDSSLPEERFSSSTDMASCRSFNMDDK